MKISFCTTCMNRLFHLRRTLPPNLRVAADSGLDVEFVLIDYGGTDGLERWVTRRCRDALKSGLLRAYRTDEPTVFRVAHAKNIAHRLAAGDILCNLDADQFLTPSYLLHLTDAFRQERPCVVRGRLSGWGRVAMQREHFIGAGGYDEWFDGWGCEDLDLCRRAQRLWNLEERVTPRSVLRLIRHSDEVRMANGQEKDKQVSHARAAQRHSLNLRSGRLQANRDRSWGEANVRRIFPRTKSRRESPTAQLPRDSVESRLDACVSRLLRTVVQAGRISSLVEITASHIAVLDGSLEALRSDAEAESLIAAFGVKPDQSLDLVVLDDAAASELPDAVRRDLADEMARVSRYVCLVSRLSTACMDKHVERTRTRYGIVREPDWRVRTKSGRRGRSQSLVEWWSQPRTTAIESGKKPSELPATAIAELIAKWRLKGIEVIRTDVFASARSVAVS